MMNIRQVEAELSSQMDLIDNNHEPRGIYYRLVGSVLGFRTEFGQDSRNKGLDPERAELPASILNDLNDLRTAIQKYKGRPSARNFFYRR